MPRTCEVCASEPSKYRCPTCGLMSCSLACTQSHKIYCAPKVQPPNPSEQTNSNPVANETSGHGADNSAQNQSQSGLSPAELGSSSELKALLEQYPSLRDQLRDIYKATLEEEWVESQSQRGRPRPFGKGRGGHRNWGPYTREKGFNRGLGKVRKLRETCEEGTETGKNAEGFMRFMMLVNKETMEPHCT
ncbi:hypothetical protein BDV59DRAFT_203276 [Aspergillus ambiguus]|uniref:zinc finger HIT domain-containing protein n=1 Tax=Aspergillus ambiguus TaxID=176160 RepID=UPI003CCD9075